MPAQTQSVPGPLRLDRRFLLLPVRHHSPACAWHARQVIRRCRPDCLLVEGPSDFEGHLEALLDPDTRPPVAVYAYVHFAQPDQPRRWQTFWPLCGFSPEYVALREAHRLGARLELIDLPSWCNAQRELAFEQLGEGDPSAAARHQESYLRRSEYIQALVRRRGCRDFDELWDRLFETPPTPKTSEQFFQALAAFCDLGRAQYDCQSLEVEGTLLRERYMAARIRQALQSAAGKVIAVVGGFHRLGIEAELEDDSISPPPLPAEPQSADRGSFLTAYSFEQLLANDEYTAGMATPGYYHRLWSRWTRARRPGTCAIDLLPDLVADLRQLGCEISSADWVAAETMARRLADLRHQPQPAREDLRDAISSSWSRESAASQTTSLIALAERWLAGQQTGRVARSAGVPPLIRDFREQLRRLRLPTTGRRQIVLDLYARQLDAQRSAFLHRLRYLGVPYADLLAGPDFVARRDRHRVRELWEAHWRPEQAAALQNQAALGPSVADAAASKLLRAAADDRASPAAAAAWLTWAWVMDLPDLQGRLLERAERALAGDSRFDASAQAAADIDALQHYRSASVQLAERLAHLAGRARQRAVDLIAGLSAVPDEAQQACATALRQLKAAILPHPAEAERFFEALARLAARPETPALLAGAAHGVLWQAEQLSDQQLAEATAAQAPANQLGDFVHGVLLVARHSATEHEPLLAAVHQALGGMQEQTFLANLPALRLAFGQLTPRELRRTARQVARWLAVEDDLDRLTIPADAVLACRRCDRAVAQSLDQLKAVSGGER